MTDPTPEALARHLRGPTRRAAIGADRVSGLLPVLATAALSSDETVRLRGVGAVEALLHAAQAVLEVEREAIELQHLLLDRGGWFCSECGRSRPHKALGLCAACHQRALRKRWKQAAGGYR